MRFRLSRRARLDLSDVRNHGVERFGPARTIAYLDGIEQAFRRILDFPDIGEARPDLGDGIRSYPAGAHRVFYLREAERVLVARVLHKRMDAGRHV